MSLILDTLRWMVGKLAAVVVIAACLTLTALGWRWVGEQREAKARLETLRSEVEAAYRDWQTHRVGLIDAERRLVAIEEERPNPILHPRDYLAWRSRMEAARAAVEATRQVRDRAKSLYESGRARWVVLEGEFDRAYLAWWQAARQTGGILGVTLVVFFLGPLVWKAFWYFGMASVAGRAEPLRLTPSDAAGRWRVADRGTSLSVEVGPERPLLARMDWVVQYAPGLAKSTRLLFDWRLPFTSYASGLREMTEIRVRDGGDSGRVVLGCSADPHAHLLALELEAHPGFVLRPGVVVAVSGSIQVRSRWHFGSLHGWIAGRLRHLLFAGTGTIYVTGHGGVELCETASPVAVEEALVLGSDSRSGFATVRTETFWPYFRDRTSLFDYRFSAGQVFLRQTAAAGGVRGGGGLKRTVESVLSGLGRVLGF